ncbi:MAG: non-canonical purine NTP pyrophosphatase [bacterium JZ-2024 1]
MMRVLIATTNPGKQREFLYLAPDSWEVIFPGSLGITKTPNESGTTFMENAFQKAQFYRHFHPGAVLAEDSGLVVPVLGGRPGIFSARYGATEAECRARLLAELADAPWENRVAYYFAAMVMISASGEIYRAEGRVGGYIAREESGNYGFGYDPIFYWPPARMTFGQLPPEIKNEVSHRAQAFRALLALLPSAYRDRKPV